MGDGINTFAGASSQQWAEAFEKAGRVRSFVLTKEIPVTPEMITAGMSALRRPCSPDYELVQGVFRAMAALAPADPRLGHPSMGSLIDNMRMEQERDAARERIAFLEAECKRLADGPPTAHPPEFVAKVLMDREGRDDPMALARLTEVIRCARLDGRKQARDDARNSRAIAVMERDDAFRRLAEVETERDSAAARCDRQAYVLGGAWNREAAQSEMIDRLTDSNCSLSATNERLRDEIAALTAEKNALADKLIPFLATVETKPKPPVHDPFRDHGGDHRRIGG